ncbi:MAG: hypothetical protein WCW52_06585 [Elusimicrobiales bacterium]|jgi:hypothetical protein
MNCGYKEKTILYFYGELPGAAELEAHLAGCASCAAELALLRGLSAEFSSFRPEPPAFRAYELARAARGASATERFLAEFRRFALAGAVTAAFLLAFQTLAHKGGTGGWGEPDSRLDSVEYGISSLRDDMTYSFRADFDYGCADLENKMLLKIFAAKNFTDPAM